MTTFRLLATALLLTALAPGCGGPPAEGDTTLAPDTGDDTTSGGEDSSPASSDDVPEHSVVHESGGGLPPNYDMRNDTPFPIEVLLHGQVIATIPPMQTGSLAGPPPHPTAPFSLTVRRADQPGITKSCDYTDSGQGGATPYVPVRWIVTPGPGGSLLTTPAGM